LTLTLKFDLIFSWFMMVFEFTKSSSLRELQLRETLMGEAAKVASALLAAMDSLEDSALHSMCASLTLQIKPWLDLNDDAIKSKFEKFSKRQHSSSQMNAESGENHATLSLREAVSAVQQFIGSNGELLDKVMTCSIEKMPEILGTQLDGLGNAFASLDSKKTSWLKTFDSQSDMTEASQQLITQVESLAATAKTILACQSGEEVGSQEAVASGAPNYVKNMAAWPSLLVTRDLRP
jgi:hypothetical protein